MQRAGVAFAALAGIALAWASPAQELTDAELLERFGLQKDVLEAAREELGTTRGLKTRGLSLVTIEEVAPVTPDDSASVASTSEAAGATATVATPEPAGTGVTATTPETSDTTITAVKPEPAGTTIEAVAPVDPNKPIQVAVFQEDLQVNLRVRFGFDSAAINPAELPKLEQMCRVMKQATDVERFRIIGHTDASGTAAYNQNLSVLRAEEVARYLTGDCGIDPSRLEVMGLGERLLYDTEEPDGEANRRVEFQAVS